MYDNVSVLIPSHVRHRCAKGVCTAAESRKERVWHGPDALGSAHLNVMWPRTEQQLALCRLVEVRRLKTNAVHIKTSPDSC